ncbi:MAG TPA: SLC13 family permease [Acidimicrobiia bacterium]
MRLARAVLACGAVAFTIACVAAPADARAAAFATWRPFVLVAGLLLVGVVAHENGIFDALGRLLARAPLGRTGFVLAGLFVVAAVTALLNLDTAAAFVTPVLLLGAMHRGDTDERILYGSLLMCNAASLLLPGSNLTNLIVLSSEHRIGASVTGARFAGAMWPAFVAAVAVTAAFTVCTRRRRRDGAPVVPQTVDKSTVYGTTGLESGVAMVAVLAALVLMLTLSDPAAPVLAVGVAAGALEIVRRRLSVGRALEAVDPALLLGLFGTAVALGTLGRGWHWPSSVLGSANPAATAAIAAGSSVVFNNLPSAALLAARPVAHARALLIGLNLGPNLAVTGSLSALLWYRTARTVGARPRLLEVTRLGVIVVPLSIAAALLAVHVVGGNSL